MKHTLAIGTLLAALTCVGSAQLSAQDSVSDRIPDAWQRVLIPGDRTVYDVVKQVTWLADFSLPLKESFGIPFCTNTEPTTPCMFQSGAMTYESATAWIAGMNAAHYLGHSDWQLPTTPQRETHCADIGPNKASFGFGCDQNALGYLYYTAFGFKAPNTAVPIPPDMVGPFRNFQPNFYWSGSSGNGQPNSIADFNFGDGSQGGSTQPDYLYVLPMIDGKIPRTPPAWGNGLEVNPGGQTIYDPLGGVAGVTWLADANVAARETFGLKRCDTPTTPAPCVAWDGSMDYYSAGQFIAAMNAYDNGAGYLGQTDWQLPPVNASCPIYGCVDAENPMGELFYNQLHKLAGMPVVEPPDISVGPFHHVLPFHYWSCEADTIQDACDATGPGDGSEFGFSFANGYLGTAQLSAEHFVTAYYPGCDLDDPMKCIDVP